MDAGSDAGPMDAGCPSDCTSTSECLAAGCVDGACVETPAPDGMTCGELSERVCVAGACVMRGCGDGYRERGPDPPREACDDGNLDDGDACSPTCEPTAMRVSPLGDAYHLGTAGGPHVAVDGSGALLMVWRRVGSATRILGRIYGRGGTLPPAGMRAPFVVGDEAGSGVPRDGAVVGLERGWVVVWQGPETMFSVQFRLVEPDGTLGPIVRVNESMGDPVAVPRVAALDDGFVVVWEQRRGGASADPEEGVRARLFASDGRALGGEMIVPTTITGRQLGPTVASDGETWLVAWTDQPFIGDTWRVFARRYRGATPLDPTQIGLALDGGLGPQVAALGEGRFAVSWRESRGDAGDILAATLGPDDDAIAPSAVVVVGATAETDRNQSIAAYGLGGEFMVAWEIADFSDPTIGVGMSPGGELPPELVDLLPAFLDAGAVRPALTAAPDGVWLTWSDSFYDESFWAFLVPGGDR